MIRLDAPMQDSKLRNYDSVRGATAYKADHRRKLHRRLSDRRERALLARFLSRLGPAGPAGLGTVLDLPCGHGRLAEFLAVRCRRLISADWSRSMVALNRTDHPGPAGAGRAWLRCSALEIPLRGRAVDLVVSFRLSHHLESQELRERHLRELFRVADRAVLVTWFSATSLKNRLRQLRAVFGHKRPKHTLHTARVRDLARECGFAARAARPLFAVGSGHVLGLFVRADGGSGAGDLSGGAATAR